MFDIHSLPEKPGVYIYKNKEGAVIYVGKAINLKKRVGSYFSNRAILQPKTLELVNNIFNISYIEVANELEALLLESKLIRKHQPKYNFASKDDKSPSYLVIFSDKTGTERINILRKGNFPLGSKKSFGPFISGDTIKAVFKILRRTLPFRDCSTIKFSRYAKLGRPCLYGLTNLCPAPCVKEEGKNINSENIKKVILLLQGKRSKLISRLRKDMFSLSLKLDYESAAKLRDQIGDLESPLVRESAVDTYLYNPNILTAKAESNISELKKILKDNSIHTKSLHRIEFYDISNIQGKQAVGSMVVATEGFLDKKNYRRFRIRKKEVPNDYEMLREVLERRLKHKEWGWPDLIILDGGKGQLSTIKSLFNDLNLDIPIVSLAKRLETIVYEKSGGDFMEINLPRENTAIRFLQQIRDEAHRFAITYHRKLRLKKLLGQTGTVPR